jgi:hypothetical protein
MADMTKKHHLLIADSIKRGVEKIIADPWVVKKLTGAESKSGLTDAQMGIVEFATNFFLKQMGETFADQLKYTHDNFDRQEFIKTVTGKVW